MDQLIKLQNDTYAAIEKARGNFKKSPKDRLTQSYIETRLETLDTDWQRFQDTHKEAVQRSSSTNSTFAQQYFTDDIHYETEELYILYKSELKDALAKVTNSMVKFTLPEPKASGFSSVKLPKISIPSFSGKYTEWTTFRDLYVSLIHKNASIDNVQKLHYLKGHLTGEAEQLVRHIPVTATNYEECWSLLNSRFDNKRFLTNSMLNRLMNQSNISVESSQAIKDLLDTTVECLNGLKNLGIDVSSWDIMIIYIVSAKLDTESRKQWEMKISTSDELPTFSQLKEFLESKFRGLEFLDTKPNKSKNNVANNNRPKSLHVTDASHTTEVSCPFCKESHKISKCKQFAKESYDARHNFVQTNGLCFNCLGANHSIKYCRVPTKCHVCKRKHHSLLHPKSNSDSTASSNKSDLAVNVSSAVSKVQAALSDGESTSKIATHFAKETISNHVLLATALVEAQTRNGCNQLLRALLDQGSQASFITESAVQLLGLRKIPTRSVISGLGGENSTTASKFIVFVNISSRHDPSFSVQVKAYVLGVITSFLPSEKLTQCSWSELEGINLADPEFHTPNKVDMLLGAEVYCQIIRDGLIKGPKGAPIAQCTALGWVLSGRMHSQSISTHCHNVVVSMHAQVDDNNMLKRFWELESENTSFTKRRLTEEEQKCEDFYHQTTERDTEGRYIVRLPFRESNYPREYGNSRDIAVKRFHLLENRFKKNPEIKAKYSEVIQEYLDLGHMERIPAGEDPLGSAAVYLPHHAVIREDKITTKVRVVFDASCKGSNDVSLNDTLMVGPTLQPDLRYIIMRWRMHPICLGADIVKMYRQVKVASSDIDFQRLVWRDNPESEIKDYRLLRVTFGTASAPYLAVKTLQQLVNDEGTKHPEVSEKIKTDYYVDDLMTGCETVEEAKRIKREMKEILTKGGFELQKWVSNSKELEDDKRDGGNQEREKDIKVDEVIKILGLVWDRETDHFKYSVRLTLQQAPITKRKVISDIARLFDPLGWAAPCVITAKIFIQKIWLSGIDWDEELPQELLKEWDTYRETLVQSSQFYIPRWLETKATDACMELHGFSDASNAAYAAVVYLRVVNDKGQVKVNLVTARTKVSPIKQVSVPRLELCGAVLLTKLICEVAEVMNIPRSQIRVWTDSTIVLAWLSNHPSKWTTFVGNRVSEIITNLDNTQWAHVQSAHNPADMASRGVTPSELAESSLWRHGPSWLQNEEIEYTRPKSISTTAEQRAIKSHVATDATSQELPIWTKFSSLRKLVRVIAYCKRFLKAKQLKDRHEKFQPYLTAVEIKEALELCIKHGQEQEFQKDIDIIAKTGRVDGKSKLKPLCPLLDDKGILRVGGRIQHSHIDDDTKHPIIIPQRSHLTQLLVHEAHAQTLHGGPTLMLNYLRTRYWVISAKNVVKAYVRKCVTCARYAAVARNQLMGQLPACRVTPSRPFLHSGVDFAGPINIRVSKGRGNRSYKGYICLFVCMATKAIHLEAISDLTSESFIAGFKRFVARRGHCSDIWSDNGKNFLGASKELLMLVNAEQSSVAQDIRGWLSNHSVTWHFIPPHAPNFGGLWEAGIKSTKHHLKRVIGNSTLTFEEIITVLSQIEACLNSRPISQINDNPDEAVPLTPGHFLVGESLITAPDRNYEQSNVGSLRRWQVTQRMVQEFWRRWSQEYLVYLMQRYKWAKQTPEPKLGDIVVVKEDQLPPARWLLGKVVEKHPGLDTVTRVVTLKCNGALMKRPTSKLCILPVAD